MGGSPSPSAAPVAKAPAKRAERIIEVEPEDIVLGDEDEKLLKSKDKGKRSLTRPTGGVAAATPSGASGVQV